MVFAEKTGGYMKIRQISSVLFFCLLVPASIYAEREAEKLKNPKPVLSKQFKKGEIRIAETVYHLETGKAEFLPENFLKTSGEDKK